MKYNYMQTLEKEITKTEVATTTISGSQALLEALIAEGVDMRLMS